MVSRRAIALTVFTLVLVQAVVFGEHFFKQQLCNNANLKLRDLDDLRRTSSEGCEENVKNAFEEFAGLATDFDVCSLTKAQAIVDFYENHLKGQHKELPTELITFVVAYGLRVNNKCQKYLVKHFYKESYAENVRQSILKSDFAKLKKWIKNDGPVARLLDPLSKQAEFVLPSDFAASVPGFMEHNKLALKVQHSSEIAEVQAICENHMRPLYENVVLPVALLAGIGLKYHDMGSAIRLATTVSQSEHVRWSRIVFLCESLREFKLMESPAGSAPELVEIEADDDGKVQGQTAEAAPAIKHLEQFESFHPMIKINKYIVPAYDIRLMRAMSAYNTTTSQTERFEEKLLKNKDRLFRATIESGRSLKTLAIVAMAGAESRQLGATNDEQLVAAKRDILDLLESDKKRSKFFSAIAKIASASKKVGRFVAHFLAFYVPYMIVTVLVLSAL